MRLPSPPFWRNPLGWWRARQRQHDIDILWPSIKQATPDMWRAKKAFAMHTHVDRAWRSLPQGEINRIIDRLS